MPQSIDICVPYDGAYYENGYVSSDTVEWGQIPKTRVYFAHGIATWCTESDLANDSLMDATFNVITYS